MNASSRTRTSVRSSVGIAIIAAACGATPPTGADTTTGNSTSTTGSGSDSLSSDPTQGTSAPTSTDSSTITGAATSDASGATASSGDTETPLEDLCPMATTEAECTALDEWCRWYGSYRVADLATCTLDEPVFSCWATDPTGAQGCFFYPLACHETDVQPVYREVDGILYLIDLQGPCQLVPRVAEGDVPWTICPADEFRPSPDVCYCLCGGIPDTTSSTG